MFSTETLVSFPKSEQRQGSITGQYTGDASECPVMRSVRGLTVSGPEPGLDSRTLPDQDGEFRVGPLQGHVVLLHKLSETQGGAGEGQLTCDLTAGASPV